MINRTNITERIKRGVVINKLDYAKQFDQLQPSESYDYLVKNHESVRTELQAQGLRLVHNPTEGYYYASRDDLENVTTFFSLIAIAQAAYNELESVDAICDPKIGISISSLITQRDRNECENLITTSRATEDITNELIDKGLVYSNKHNNIVMTQSARSMFETHLDK